MSFADAVDYKARQLCRYSVRMTAAAGSGHPSSAASLAHLTVVLMYHKMRYDLANPWNPHSDRLVLSEGHAVPIIYAAYADLGGVFGADPADARKLTVDDVMNLRDIDSPIDGHPNPAVGFPFFDAATGSLGQGVSVAAGLGLAARLDGSDRTIYVLCGDGEAREGQIWEALDFIADFGLTNVRVVFNCNGMGQSDYVSPQQSAETLARKVEAFGLHAETIDGHDANAISKALSLDAPDGKPVVVIAKTVKGWGVSELQQVGYHGKPLSADDVDKALDELALPDPPPDMQLCPAMPKGEIPQDTSGPITLPDPDFAALAADQKKLADSAAKGKLATRHAYGLTLRALGEASDRIVALDGDVSNSTFSRFFAEKFPDRYFEGRIAEQNMVSAAAGLAAAGKIPFGNSFAKFLVRAYDQIEMAANSCVNLKLVGSHSGVSLGADGPSQMGVVDTAFFGALASVTTPEDAPGAVVLNPCDGVSTYKLVVAMANHDGLAYMRTLRPATPMLYEPQESFDLLGHKVLAEGGDLTLVAWGYMVHEAKKVADALSADGIACRLIDAYSLPLAADFVQASGAADGVPVLVVEDNYAGGLGSAVAVAIGRAGGGPVDAVTVPMMPKSGKTADDILAYVGMDVDAVCRRAKALVKPA